MKKNNALQRAFRIGFYVLGLFVIALGVAVSLNSDLGISPVNSLPYVVSQITGLAMGTWVIIIFCSYILMQAVILRREFKLINLTQIVFSTIFGLFVDFARMLLGDFTLPTYGGRLVMLAVSILLVALGVFLYISVDIVPMPMEGLSLAIARKANIPFPKMKVIVDCVVVSVSIVLSLLFFHGLEGVREGTVATAVLSGTVIGVLKKLIGPAVQRLCFSNDGTQTV